MVHALECPWPCSAEQHTYLRRIHVIILHSKTVRLFVSIRLCSCTLAAFVLHLQRDFPILTAHLPFCSTHLRPSSLCCSPESDSATRSLAWLLTIAWFLSKAWTANVGVCNLCVGQDVWTDLCTMSSVSCLPNNLHTFAWFVYIYIHMNVFTHTHTRTLGLQRFTYICLLMFEPMRTSYLRHCLFALSALDPNETRYDLPYDFVCKQTQSKRVPIFVLLAFLQACRQTNHTLKKSQERLFLFLFHFSLIF